MRNRRFTLFLLLLLSVLYLPAQNFQPANANSFFSFTDSLGRIYHIEVTQATASGNDSIFQFNRVCRDIVWNHPGECGGNTVAAHYVCEKENIFGDYMRKTPNGDYFFHAKDGNTFYIPVNNFNGTFTFYSGASALITGNYSQTIPSPYPAYPNDSIRIFNLSNGKTIEISNNHGIVKGFDFMGLDTFATVTNTFTRSELNNPPVVSYQYRDITELYDWQAGDVAISYEELDYSGLFVWQKVWNVDSVINVVSVPGQNGFDTLKITINRRSLVDLDPYPSSNVDTTYWTPASTITAYVIDRGNISKEFNMETFTYLHDAGPNPDWGNNYAQYYHPSWWIDTCNNLVETIDYYAQETFTYPYGLTYRRVVSFSTSTFQLLCFSRGSQVWGTCPNFNTILNVDELEPGFEVLLSPNPGHDDVTISCTNLAGSLVQSADLEVQLTDLSGKLLIPSVEGQGKVTLNTAHLPPGIYLIKISNSHRGTIKKWVKTH